MLSKGTPQARLSIAAMSTPGASTILLTMGEPEHGALVGDGVAVVEELAR